MSRVASMLGTQPLRLSVKVAHNRLLWLSLWTLISASVRPLPAPASEDLRLRLHESQQGSGYTGRARSVGKHVESGCLLVWVGRDCFQACLEAMVSLESAEHA